MELDLVREFVIAGHGNLPRLTALLHEHPELLNVRFAWSETDLESAIQGAAHVGNRAIAEYLAAQGADVALATAAMLGWRDRVDQLLAEDPARIHEAGAHGIPLLPHAAHSGDLALVQSLFSRGASEGASMALSHAARRGDQDMVLWLLDHAGPDLTWKNFQGKTAATVAADAGYADLAARLQARS
jgi:ankyrin repeat protein